MAESQDYKVFKKNVPQYPDRLDRVENVVVDGMFDISMTIDGVDVWIEMKHPTEPKRATTPLFGSNHKLSVDQSNWALRHRQAGGKAYVLIASDKRWLLMDAEHADEINIMTVSQLMDLALITFLKPVRDTEYWKMLRRTLRNGK